MDICAWEIFSILKKLANANPQKEYKYYGFP